MSHHKHTTEAYILAVKAVKEGDARIKFVTKDGEVLSAIATGLRLLKSKLRMSVVQYSHVSVSLVRGKDVWRLTNANSIKDYFSELKSNSSTALETRKALARIVSLVEKLTPGEMQVGGIFERLINYSEILLKENFLNKSELLNAYETQTALFIMTDLGYIENASKWQNATIEYIQENIKTAIKDINHGIQSTHLI